MASIFLTPNSPPVKKKLIEGVSSVKLNVAVWPVWQALLSITALQQLRSDWTAPCCTPNVKVSTLEDMDSPR